MSSSRKRAANRSLPATPVPDYKALYEATLANEQRLKDKVEALEERNELLSRQKTTAAGTLKKTVEILEEQKKESDTKFTSQLDRLRLENSGLSANFEELNIKLRMATQNLVARDRAIDYLDLYLKEAKANLESLQSSNQQLQAQLDASASSGADQLIDGLRSDIEGYKSRVALLETRSLEWQDYANSLLGQLGESHVTNNNLIAEINRLQGELANLNNECAKLNAQIIMKNNQLFNAKNHPDSIKRELVAYKTENERLRAEVDRLRSETVREQTARTSQGGLFSDSRAALSSTTQPLSRRHKA